MKGDMDEIGMEEDMKEESEAEIREKMLKENYQLDQYKRLLQIINEKQQMKAEYLKQAESTME